MKFQITNTYSSQVLGTYEAETQSQALDMMAVEAGYADYEAAQHAAPSEVGEILVTEVRESEVIAAAVQNAENLNELIDALNAAASYAKLHGVDVDMLYDASDLPTFGRTSFTTVPGIYSWDEDRLLQFGGEGWLIRDRSEIPDPAPRDMRAIDLRTIESLYGFSDEETVLEVMQYLGADAFTDEGLAALAHRQRMKDERPVRRSNDMSYYQSEN
ncbi:MAG: hypothetical protein KJ944_08560 [Alphaproteobacteria bacterium]|nr:hypothetical protein [Alphaproteobacteria bacterium]MBU1561533.1 hypothetical protein [Alphaproteobacteria bacterium]MBU2302634.1 hypothetical protein [Alphaproteobacteria bacterium]MBU2367708.1 hypothetical protein [Alphaproteobacteria bacterium]